MTGESSGTEESGWGLAVAAANAPLTPPKGPEAN